MPQDPTAAAESIMRMAMSQSMSAANSGRRSQAKQGLSEEDKAWKSAIDKLISEGKYGQARKMISLAQSQGSAAPLQAAQAQIDTAPTWAKAISELLGQGKSSPSPSKLGQGNIAFNVPEPVKAAQSKAQQRREAIDQAKADLSDILIPETVRRIQIKQAAGIDIENREQDAKQLMDYRDMKAANPLMKDSEIWAELGANYGYITKYAMHFKNASLEERKALGETYVNQKLNNPKYIKWAQQKAPNVNPSKIIKAMGIAELVDEGVPLSDKDQLLWDRIVGMEDEYNSIEARNKATITAAETGARIGAEHANRFASAATSGVEAKASKKAQLEGEFEMEALKPISAEDRAKYGIGASVPTYESLADQGVRFPTEADRKTYQTLSAVREQITGMRDLLFGKDGVFEGVGKDWVSRKGAQVELVGDRAKGTRKGQNYEIYQDTLASMARRLLALAGESGGRFTDKDVEQIVKSAPDLGGVLGPMDSYDIAQRKFERFVVNLNRMLSDVTQNTVIKPTGGARSDENGLIGNGKKKQAPKEALDLLKNSKDKKQALKEFEEVFGFIPEGY